MSDSKKDGIEGHYNYYGIPAYILKQKNGAYASGFFDCNELVFKAGGSAKKILWDGIRLNLAEARRLIEHYAKSNQTVLEDDSDRPDWILLPEEATFYLAQQEKMRTEGAEIIKKLGNAPKEKGPEKR